MYKEMVKTNLVNKSTRFISLTRLESSPSTSSSKPLMISGTSLSGVIEEYHRSTTKSLNNLSIKLSIEASTKGESTFLLHFVLDWTGEKR
jgi:hypothetical protein